MPSGASFIAAGNINPCRVVKKEAGSGKNFTVLEAAALTDLPVGIAQEGTYYAPGVSTNTYAAFSGVGLRVYQDGEECLAEAASAILAGAALTVNGSTDARVVSNALGGSTAGWVVGYALEDASGAGSKLRMIVRIQHSKALT